MAAELADGHAGASPRPFAHARPSDGATARPTAADAPSRPRGTSSTSTGPAMSALIEIEDLREVAARRELYRRLARTGDEVVEVAERVWYSVLKET